MGTICTYEVEIKTKMKTMSFDNITLAHTVRPVFHVNFVSASAVRDVTERFLRTILVQLC